MLNFFLSFLYKLPKNSAVNIVLSINLFNLDTLPPSSSIKIGFPPEKGKLQICTLGGNGLKVGFTGNSSSQLDPKSPPLT